MTPGTLLEASGLEIAYRGRPVVREASLRLRAGEVAGVVGENGAGKTTLLRALAGLVAPRAGTVTAAGRVGYAPQEPALFEGLTAREHFRYVAAARAMRAFEPAMVRLAERLRFASHLDVRVERLSGGTRQKLNVSLALLSDPEVLLLDEPYAALDGEAYLRFWEVAGEARARGRALLLVSNLVHDRERFDALYALEGGVLRCS